MIIHREIGLSYHHKPIVKGVNYSPLMVESKEEVLVKEERWWEATPAAIPPQIFLQQIPADPCFVFFVFLHCLLSRTPRGAFK
jgi:hypothetical protein